MFMLIETHENGNYENLMAVIYQLLQGCLTSQWPGVVCPTGCTSGGHTSGSYGLQGWTPHVLPCCTLCLGTSPLFTVCPGAYPVPTAPCAWAPSSLLQYILKHRWRKEKKLGGAERVCLPPWESLQGEGNGLGC